MEDLSYNQTELMNSHHVLGGNWLWKWVPKHLQKSEKDYESLANAWIHTNLPKNFLQNKGTETFST